MARHGEGGDGVVVSMKRQRIAVTSGKALYAVVAIDQYGGHRHWFRVVIAGKNPLTTESLAAAMRQYNRGGKE